MVSCYLTFESISCVRETNNNIHLMMPSKHIYSLLFGILLGLSLSTILFYPNKVSNVFLNGRIKNFNGHSLETKANQSLADDLSKKVRVLCFILTTPKNHKTRAFHVKNSWGKKCNRLLFMSSEFDLELETIALPVTEGRLTLWDKTRLSFQYVYNYHFNDAEWFLKADDDS